MAALTAEQQLKGRPGRGCCTPRPCLDAHLSNLCRTTASCVGIQPSARSARAATAATARASHWATAATAACAAAATPRRTATAMTTWTAAPPVALAPAAAQQVCLQEGCGPPFARTCHLAGRLAACHLWAAWQAALPGCAGAWLPPRLSHCTAHLPLRPCDTATWPLPMQLCLPVPMLTPLHTPGGLPRSPCLPARCTHPARTRHTPPSAAGTDRCGDTGSECCTSSE